jgi:hypothetical protein
MTECVSRRRFLAAAPVIAAAPLAGAASQPQVGDQFPTHASEVVKEVVGVSHGNFDRVRQLVDRQPALAKVAWDWGFGDWESAIDAASHVGNRPIAEYLISKGARPTLFTATMLGQLDVVKGVIAMSPGIQRTRGPHGITLLAHARFGGDNAVEVLKFLESLGDADPVYAPVALTAAEKLALSGVYVFGSGANDRFEVTEDKRGFPSILRPGGTTRALIHLGSMQFHPIGADTVRIKFEMAEGRATALTVHDPELVVTAKRGGATL